MALCEKQICSLRYLWRIWVYASNVFLILLSVGIIGWGRNLADAQKMTQLMMELSQSAQYSEFTETIVLEIYFVIFICGCLCFGILVSMGRFIGYDMENRKDTRALLMALGYRRRDIVRYERTYFLFDLAVAWAVAAVVLLAAWQAVRGGDAIGIFLDIMEISYFVNGKEILMTGFLVLAGGWLSVSAKT